MKLLFENWRQYLNEKVYGNLISVFSRTTSEKNIANIVKNGWKTQQYGDYGPAIYMIYQFEPNDRADRGYGTHVMRFGLKANNKLLVLGDPEAATKIFGTDLSVEEQVKTMAPEALQDEKIAKWAEKSSQSGSYRFMFPADELKKYFNGFLMKSGKDAHLAVIYAPEDVLSMTSWAKIPKDYEFKSDEEMLKAQAEEAAMEDIRAAVMEEYLGEDPYVSDPSFDPRLETPEQIIKIVQEDDPEVSTIADVVELLKQKGYYYISLEPAEGDHVSRRDVELSHTKDFSDVQYDKGSLQWNKEIAGIKLPQRIKMQ